ncbi:MAG: hypothetical protein ACPGU9_01685 [Flavobacteriaceae bacterium]
MGSNYTLLIRFSLGFILILLGANEFVHFSNFFDFSADLYGLNAIDLFYGSLFLISGIALLFKKAVPLALIILAFFAVQVLSYILKHNPSDMLSPIGLVGVLIFLNLVDNKQNFKNLFN